MSGDVNGQQERVRRMTRTERKEWAMEKEGEKTEMRRKDSGVR